MFETPMTPTPDKKVGNKRINMTADEVRSRMEKKYGKKIVDKIYKKDENAQSSMSKPPKKEALKKHALHVEKNPEKIIDQAEVEKAMTAFQKIDDFVRGYEGEPEYDYLRERAEYYKQSFTPEVIVKLLKSDLEIKPILDRAEKRPKTSSEITVHDNPKNYARQIDIRGLRG